MKKIIIYLLLLLLNLFLFAQNEIVFNEKFLSSCKWKEMETGWRMEFSEDNKFSIGIRGGGEGTTLKGTYQITENEKNKGFYSVVFKLVNTDNVDYGSTPEWVFGNRNIMSYHYDNECLDYPVKLSTEKGLKFAASNIVVKEGNKKKVGNIDVITMGLIEIKSIENVKLRETPGINSKTILFGKYSNKKPDDPFDIENLSFMPKDTSVTVLAKTANKEKVQDWENYWYYISYADDSCLELGSYGHVVKNAWVFAGFFK